MKRDVAKKWVKALRSGKYEQGRGYLREGDTWCCLGVLCDVLGMKGRTSGDVYTFGKYSYENLPPKAVKLAGMCSNAGIPTDGARISLGHVPSFSLADANDRGVTFPKIADYIEANWKKL